jgi:hypothetical protein
MCFAPDCNPCIVYEGAADDCGSTFPGVAGETECGRPRRSLDIRVRQYSKKSNRIRILWALLLCPLRRGSVLGEGQPRLFSNRSRRGIRRRRRLPQHARDRCAKRRANRPGPQADAWPGRSALGPARSLFSWILTGGAWFRRADGGRHLDPAYDAPVTT